MYREAYCCYPALTPTLVEAYFKNKKLSLYGDSTTREIAKKSVRGFINNKTIRRQLQQFVTFPYRWGLGALLDKSSKRDAQAVLRKAINFGDLIVFHSCAHDIGSYKMTVLQKEGRRPRSESAEISQHEPATFKANVLKKYKQRLPLVIDMIKSFINETRKDKQVFWLSCNAQGYDRKPRCRDYNREPFNVRVNQFTRKAVEREKNWSFIDIHSMLSVIRGRLDVLNNADIHFGDKHATKGLEHLRTGMILSQILFSTSMQ